MDGAPRPPEEDNPKASPSPRPSWAVGVDISGGDPPYAIRLMDAEERTIGSARVGKPGPIRLNVRGEVAAVTVVVIDGQDQKVTGQASPNSSNVSLILGE